MKAEGELEIELDKRKFDFARIDSRSDAPASQIAALGVAQVEAAWKGQKRARDDSSTSELLEKFSTRIKTEASSSEVGESLLQLDQRSRMARMSQQAEAAGFMDVGEVQVTKGQDVLDEFEKSASKIEVLRNGVQDPDFKEELEELEAAARWEPELAMEVQPIIDFGKDWCKGITIPALPGIGGRSEFREMVCGIAFPSGDHSA